MGLKEKFEEKIKKKEQEIHEYEANIREAEVYIMALQDSIRMLPREERTEESAKMSMKVGSDPYKTMALIRKAGKPLHIKEILNGLGKPITKKNMVSLAGTLGWYVRDKRVFTRPMPNTFGLIELEKPAILPDEFGLLDEEVKGE